MSEVRQCLKCNRDFKSTGPGNRICKRCFCGNAKIIHNHGAMLDFRCIPSEAKLGADAGYNNRVLGTDPNWHGELYRD